MPRGGFRDRTAQRKDVAAIDLSVAGAAAGHNDSCGKQAYHHATLSYEFGSQSVAFAAPTQPHSYLGSLRGGHH